jgi:hypothetical protein
VESALFLGGAWAPDPAAYLFAEQRGFQ